VVGNIVVGCAVVGDAVGNAVGAVLGGGVETAEGLPVGDVIGVTCDGGDAAVGVAVSTLVGLCGLTLGDGAAVGFLFLLGRVGFVLGAFVFFPDGFIPLM
jgi:hypothetical protein